MVLKKKESKYSPKRFKNQIPIFVEKYVNKINISIKFGLLS